MDLHMPDLGGVDATRAITNGNPAVGVLVLTMFDDSESVFNAMRAGARGYLLKGAEPEELVRAVHAVARGEAIFGQSIAAQVLRYFNGLPASPAASFPELTAREREVLELIAAGRNNSEIAQVLSLSGKTVRNHVSIIFSKLRVADRAQAIVRAREAGLGQRPGGVVLANRPEGRKPSNPDKAGHRTLPQRAKSGHQSHAAGPSGARGCPGRSWNSHRSHALGGRRSERTIRGA